MINMFTGVDLLSTGSTSKLICSSVRNLWVMA